MKSTISGSAGVKLIKKRLAAMNALGVDPKRSRSDHADLAMAEIARRAAVVRDRLVPTRRKFDLAAGLAAMFPPRQRSWMGNAQLYRIASIGRTTH